MNESIGRYTYGVGPPGSVNTSDKTR